MPARLSTVTKAVRGTARPDRAPKPDAATPYSAVPRAPKHLSERAQCEWKRLAPAAVALGTFRTTDERAFGLLCEVLAREAEARETIEREGYTVPTADGGKKPHPAVRVAEMATAQATRLFAEFGLTPRARQGVAETPSKRRTPAISSDDCRRGCLARR